MSVAEEERVDGVPPSTESSLIDSLGEAFRDASNVATASIALLRSELRLARSSAMTIIWLAFALIVLGGAAWLTVIAAMVAGIYQASGNIFFSIASVALVNLVGVVWVLFAMRRCWRDLSLPQTRALIVSSARPSPDSKKAS